MTVLILGASGATGSKLVQLLLEQGINVKAVVRSKSDFINSQAKYIQQNNQLSIIQANILAMSNAELTSILQGCQAVVSCLGHNLNFKGLFCQPKRLVTQAIQKVCHAIEQIPGDAPYKMPIKLVLMNTTGNQNHKAGEKVSVSQSLVISLLRLALPPHADNEDAAQYLQTNHAQTQSSNTTQQIQTKLEWVVVRPDSLTNDTKVSTYEIYPSPIRSAIFDPGKTSRINAAHFMSQLIRDNTLWQKWRSQMPVIYNADYIT
ncbi:NAD(P)-dependent oxidoreductase [Catenovulum maritimum]|uniref:NAD-dependent epimerase/dehydratase n=1 Tax=Catenovulum maritimum TaxID=1513271 RepID=A0A0J8GTE1_9ALTE|nr:NAD(P)-binding oxidoreductase [Catenovulum maritimum]KMT66002.1 NAD-dependent epimerase/dehydratase [Catenovulum maritimum]